MGYRMLNLFPDSSILITHPIRVLGIEFRYSVVFRMIALAHDRSEALVRVLRWRPELSGRGLMRRIAELSEAARLLLARRGALRILTEDWTVCAKLQAQARQIAPETPLGAAETRVSWFNEAYADIMRGAAPPS